MPAAEAPEVVILALPRGHSARRTPRRIGWDRVAITVQWVPAWSLDSAERPDGLSLCAFFLPAVPTPLP